MATKNCLKVYSRRLKATRITQEDIKKLVQWREQSVMSSSRMCGYMLAAYRAELTRAALGRWNPFTGFRPPSPRSVALDSVLNTPPTHGRRYYQFIIRWSLPTKLYLWEGHTPLISETRQEFYRDCITTVSSTPIPPKRFKEKLPSVRHQPTPEDLEFINDRTKIIPAKIFRNVKNEETPRG